MLEKHRGHNEHGFTFLEMLLVLSVMAILTIIILPIGDKWIKEKTEREAMQAFIAAIYDMQAYSIAHNAYTRMAIRNGGRDYITYVSSEEIARGSFPEGMYYASSVGYRVEFQGDGNIVNSGTATLVGKSGDFEIRFQFLRGRVVVYELERIFVAGSNPHVNGRHCHLRYAFAIRSPYECKFP